MVYWVHTVAIIARLQGGGKPPYGTNGTRSVGATSVRPCDLAATQDPTGEQCLPLQFL